ncbi:MAG TPA: 3-deoxy-8-phosphooctulonate synthase, partial [Opitutae bacterium]|nr:3-deoxy-8-phosphooctulonate synthase [Opitutae bacterium]
MLHDKRRLLLIAGPCSLESESNVRMVAKELRALADREPDLNIIFKGSYDKANRTSLTGDRGPGMEAGLELLALAKKDYGFATLTDIHGPEHCVPVAKV